MLNTLLADSINNKTPSVALTQSSKKIIAVIIAGCLLIAIGTLVLGYQVISGERHLHQTADILYNHPFKVSQAASRMDKNVHLMHDAILELGYSPSHDEIDAQEIKLKLLERSIIQDLQFIDAHFLGDKEQINTIKSDLENWKTVRSKAIVSAREDDKASLMIQTRIEKEIEVFDKVNRHLHNVVSFAQQKAARLTADIDSKAKDILHSTYILLPILLLFIGLIALLMVRRTKTFIISEQEYLQTIVHTHNRFSAIFNQSPIGIAMIDSLSGEILEVNLKFAEIAGRTIQEMVNINWMKITHADDIQEGLDNMALLNAGKISCFNMEKRYIHPDGSYVWIKMTTSSLMSDDNASPRHLCMITDISQQKQSEEKLKLAASVFSHAKEGILITDAAANIVEMNEAFSDITGYSRDELIEKNPRFLSSGEHSSEFYVEMWQSLIKKGYWSGEIWNKRKNGEIYPEILTISSVYDVRGTVQNYVALFSDITAIKNHQEKLERIAHFDVLTNLPNRILLADRLTQAMTQCQRHNRSLAVVFLDLDGFKAINDAHGHSFGDQLLVALSQSMKETLRDSDTLSRFGGDEFVAVLADLDNIQDCEPVLERLLKAVSIPVTIAGTVVKCSASIGVTLYPRDSADADKLIRHADQAMYSAKLKGKNRYHFFDTEQDDAAKLHRDSLVNIRSALQKREFVLYYQPKVNIKSGDVIGAEALIRWQHPVRGLLSPIEFLPVIENHTVSIDLGEWVIETALQQVEKWQALGLNIPVSVNISAYQLQSAGFVARLTTLLAAHPKVDPCYLELEVLETSELSDLIDVSAVMRACIELGVSFALDDFGTGYSSLTYLRHLPATMVKIDQSFIRDMLENPDDLAIVEGVVGLAKAFQRNVIAEGVETIAHGRMLSRLGCNLLQGYGIAKPMPAEYFPDWAADWALDDVWQDGCKFDTNPQKDGHFEISSKADK